MNRSDLARRAIRVLASRIRDDRLVIVDGAERTVVGRAGAGPEITVHDARAYGAVLRGGSIGLGEAYADGLWDTTDLTETLRVLLRATRPVLHFQDRLAATTRPVSDLVHRLRTPDRGADRSNIRAHYDVSNDFFELMLDPTMAYSCGIFETPDASLEAASVAKFERVCRTLQLGPDDHLVEIGTGWGGLAIHAARNYGCRVTTTTISQEQFDYASKRIAEAGLSSQVAVRADHYRDLAGTYDKLVSIEMIEAVPWWEFDDYFEAIARLVRPGGLALVQAITMNDVSYERAKRHDDFIKRYVFPGGNLPSVRSMTTSANRVGLHLCDLLDIGMHYPPTLRAWAANVREHAEEIAVVAPHLDNDHFRRQWYFYLCYCEAAFLERHISDVQVLWSSTAR